MVTCENIRLTWQLQEWTQTSTNQVRVIPGGRVKTIFSFHLEKLPDEAEREKMHQCWKKVLGELRAFFHCLNC